MSVIKFFRQIFAKAPFRIVQLIFFMIVAGALEGIGFTVFIPLVKAVTSPGDTARSGGEILPDWVFSCLGPNNRLFVILAFLIAVIAFKNIFTYFQRICTAKISVDFEVDLKKDISASVLASDWRFYLDQKSGTIMNALGQGSKIAAMGFQVVSLFCAEVVNVILYCIVGGLISWQAFLMSVIAGGVYVFLSRHMVRKSRSIGEEGVKYTNDAQRCIVEDLNGIKFIKSNALEDQRKKTLFGLMTAIGTLEFKREKYAAILDTMPEVMMTAVMCVVFYVSYVHLKVPGENLLVLLAVLYRFNRRIMALQTLRQRIVNYIPFYELCSELVRTAGLAREVTGTEKFDVLKTGIRFSSVDFSYSEEHPVLRGIDLFIKKNEFVAFLGKSGSGKTTILDLITGLLKAPKGGVSIDDIPIGRYDIFTWRKKLGYVSQDPFLVNGTIADNIRMSALSVSDEEVLNVAKMAYADEFICQFPDGYSTVVGDSGMKLSGGQRQRIALARALVRKPQVLILDEATSALDNNSESMIQRAIDGLKGHLTIIVVAHRLASINSADKVYLLHEGRISNKGTLEELRKNSSVFRELYHG
ncbi:MAG TPA: ABC transporter ATP-binding protein [Candidatus Omnitrophota bacterium]|nr:ABC transporter ATP-binding protein [Candidatus Omnitrophota bacterium]HPS19538.1 ABC transporter ATP-binding protein [Candidatus Omnitrophota bacterium]